MFRFTTVLFLTLFSVSSSFALEIEPISQTKQGLTIKVNLPNFHTEERKREGYTYQLLTVDGWGRTEAVGSPQLPFRSMLIGIPTQSNVQAELIRWKVEELSGLTIYPCPRKEVEESEGVIYVSERFYRDEGAYSQDTYFPGKVVKVSETGYMRGQRVVKLNIYPFQYNPVEEKLKVYREMVIRVDFKGGEILPSTFSKEELPYEEMLKRSLVNYESLNRYEGEDMGERRTISREEKAGGISDLKIHLTSEGIYKVTYSNLSPFWSLGVLDPRKIQLKHLGVEVPILFIGEGDGEFNATDYFLFYVPPLESDFTKDDVYWLSVGSTNGLRMSEVDGSLGGGTHLTSFTNLYHGEEDEVYWETIPNGEGQDHWFWVKLVVTAPSQPVSSDITFTLNNILSTSENCTLTVSFRGKTDDLNFNPDHHTQTSINGYMAEDDTWNGQIEFEKTVTFSQSHLKEGTNTLTVKSVGDTGATVDTLYFNWFDLTYKDTYVAEGNLLKFKGEGSGACEMDVSGFSSPDIFVFDISDLANPKKVINTTITPSYTLKFTDTISGDKAYIAVTSGSARIPTSLEADVPSSLKSASNGADIIIITHEDFYDAIEPLATYRASQGKRVMVVKVGYIYDEFSYGLFDPQAIRDFLKYAYEHYQSPAPLYCLLVGDANIDYKDNLHTGRKNYVPTHIFETVELGETPTDNWFVCVSGEDVIPDMYIGRISVKEAPEVTDVINKIMSCEKADDQAWNKQVLFLADNETSFESVDDTLAADYLPAVYQSYKVYLSKYTSTQAAKNDLISKINDGKLMTVYTGHGSVDNWAGEYLFTSDDVPQLSNSMKPTFVVALSCLNGFFPSPDDDYCLGETFLNAKDKGAVACFVPTSLGYTWQHSELTQELFDSIFMSGHQILGQATTEAKINAYSRGVPSDIIEAFVLLGDPSSELKASGACSTWSEVINQYNTYVNGQSTWSDVIACYTEYASQ